MINSLTNNVQARDITSSETNLSQTNVIFVQRPLSPVSWIDTVPVPSADVPCTVSALDLHARVDGLYAEVVVTITLSNPNARDISVPLAIPLPDRAVVCGYALDVNGQLVDGVVVPKEEARVVFEAEQCLGIDPGLVEAVKGNVYRTRVYPVPAQGRRTMRLTFVAPLLLCDGTGAALDMPMPAESLEQRTICIDVEMLDCPAPQLSGLGDLCFEEAAAFWSVKSSEKDVITRDNIRVALPVLPKAFARLEQDDDGTVWFSASEAVGAVDDSDIPSIDSITVLWDTSGSRAETNHKAEMDLLKSWCTERSGVSYRLIAFGATTREPCAFDSVDALVEAIVALRYDGGTDFVALSHDLEELYAGEIKASGCDACILFTDGFDTLSGEPLAFPGECDVLAIVSDTERDTGALRQACGGRVFDIAAAPKSIRALAIALFGGSQLTSVMTEGVASVIGIGSGADGRYAVVGRMTDERAAISFANTGTRFELSKKDAVAGGILARAWAAEKVAQLSPRAAENEEELLALGRRFGVVSPVTSLLVLESLDQWLGYDIEPPKTLEEIHKKWVQAQSGRMQHTSEQGRKDDHLRSLVRAWRETLDWWERDFSNPLPDKKLGDSPSRRESADSFRTPQDVCGATLDVCGATLDACEAQLGVTFDMQQALSDESEVVMRRIDAMSMPSCSSPEMHFSLDDDAATESGGCNATVTLQPWSPDAPYLAALDEAFAKGALAVRDAYYMQRLLMKSSPSFYLDCAGWFLAHDDREFGLQVLSNLAELRIEDAALLRVLAWRLREAGELERALVTSRRILKLRGEDSQSHRDVALVLDELAREAFAQGDEARAKSFAEEAGAVYRETALTPWSRHPLEIGLFAVEEYNVLRAWVMSQVWKDVPSLPSLGSELEGVLASDLRISLAWDADETDVDIHVTEPSGEEAYYGNPFTHSGGRVSEDITDGFGPELYEIRKAQEGLYTIRAHYFASHQQTIFGPATCTLAIYTDWGRPMQTKQVTSMRLDNKKEMSFVGTASYGGQYLR